MRLHSAIRVRFYKANRREANPWRPVLKVLNPTWSNKGKGAAVDGRGGGGGSG